LCVCFVCVCVFCVCVWVCVRLCVLCVYECIPRSILAKSSSKLDSNIGQHHWPAAVAITINTTGQLHGQHHW